MQVKANSRKLVIDALNFLPTSRVPKDLGSHRSTGISCFAYPKLVSALKLPHRLPKIYDIGQMLSIVDYDVLEALGCDVVLADVSVNGPYFTNAFEQEDNWQYFDFGGRLEALIPKDKFDFQIRPDGSIFETTTQRTMAADSYVFDQISGGQPFDLSLELNRLDLDQFKEKFEADNLLSDSQAQKITHFVHEVRNSTDKAVHLSRSPFTSLIWIGGHSGIAQFPMLCYQHPEYVHQYHKIQTDVMLANLRKLLPAIADYVDIIDLGSGDWGTQSSLIASPQMYKEFFVPYFKILYQEADRIAQHLKRLAHSCGAIYNLLDIMMDEVGIQVINPVQWTTSGPDGYKKWKAKTDKKMGLWGGGVNSQATLPAKSVNEVVDEVKTVVPVLSRNGGYVFNNIHNILAEIEPEKIIAMYNAVDNL